MTSPHLSSSIRLTLIQHPRRPLQGARGFALIITILLMSFLVLLIVSMASLTRVETQIAFNSQQQNAAQDNALTALKIALGQLQAAAGPDQRVTARAEILDSASTNLRKVSGSLEQPLWTGVWKSGSASLDIANTGDPQRKTSLGSTTPTAAQKAASATWLVSNPTPATPVDPRTFVGTSANSVDLATKVGPNQDITVTVPLVPFTATPAGFSSPQPIGQYAYWVSDEGVKAKVNIKDPTAQKTYSGAANLDPVTHLPTNLLHFAAPQSIAAHKILPDTLATDFRAAPLLDRVLVPQQLQFLPAAAPTGFVVNKYMADITTYSFGVLADARNGGLKKDLTATFEDSGNTSGKNYNKLNSDGLQYVYSTATDSVPLITPSYGLRWLNLFTHYNLYKATFPAINMGGLATNPSVSFASFVPAGVGNPDASGRPYALAPRAYTWKDSDSKVLTFGSLAPVCLGLRWDVSVNSEPAAGGYTLVLNYYPQLILYNPYAVAIKVDPRAAGTTALNNLRYSRTLLAARTFYLETTVTPPSGTPKSYFTLLNHATTLQRLALVAGFDDMQTFQPGEIRVFGLTAANSGPQPDPSTIPITSSTYTRTASGNMTPMTAACEILDTVAPYGMLSRGHAANLSRSAKLQVLTALSITKVGTYAPFPVQPGSTTVQFRFVPEPTAAMISAFTAGASGSSSPIIPSGSSEVSLPRARSWPFDGFSGAGLNALPGLNGSINGRLGGCLTPGLVDSATGRVVPISRKATSMAQRIDGLTEQTLVYSYYVRKKGVNATGGTTYTDASLAVPYFNGNSATFNPINDYRSAGNWDEVYTPGAFTWQTNSNSVSQTQLGITRDGYTTTTWGDRSLGDAPPSAFGSRIILADVPVQPMLSLGQFMHLQQFHHFQNNTTYNQLAFGSMFVGGSVNSAEVPTSQSGLSVPSSNGTPASVLLDHSFLANQALFDSYFFSTVPPAGNPPSGTSWPNQWTAFNAANPGTRLADSTMLLPNSRIVPIQTNGLAPLLGDLRDMDQASANLLLNGAFNINSTSVDAWRALLSSLSGNDLSIWDATKEEPKTLLASQLLNPLSRFWSANGGGDVNTLWSGVRALSDTEVTNLATAIVAQVKARGPFLSMADFLNRRLGSETSDLARAGALQAAIDRTSLNDSVKSSGVSVTGITAALVAAKQANVAAATATSSDCAAPIPANLFDASSSTGAAWNSTLGAPGYLMQQDLVQAFSPVMAARSDTFVIRTYGSAVNPATGKTVSKAWLEAVVQRLPEFVDSLDPALAALGAATPVAAVNPTNKNFGRRFKIMSMRWLSPNEI